MTKTTLKQAMAALPGIGVSLLPKLMCPACCVFCSYGSVKCPPVQAQGRCYL